jgi:RNA polymerase sigma factor (sigma-70 family)
MRRTCSGFRAVLRRLTRGDVGLADELAQEAFLRAYQALPEFRAEARFRTWLYRIAYHQFLQHQRRGALPPTGVAADVEEPSTVDDGLSASVALGLDLQRALEALSEPERVAIAHCYFADLSHADAAEVLGWPLGSVKTHLARGKDKLRIALAAWAPPAVPMKQERQEQEERVA